MHPDDVGRASAAEHAEPPPPTRTLRKLPLAVIVKLDEVMTEFLLPRSCHEHSFAGPRRDCPQCDFRKGCIAVEPRLSRGTFNVEVTGPVSGRVYELRVQRRQVPLTIKAASTLHTTGHHDGPGPHISLALPALLFRGAQMASNVRCTLAAAVVEAANLHWHP